jgi:hypothetical protein
MTATLTLFLLVEESHAGKADPFSNRQVLSRSMASTYSSYHSIDCSRDDLHCERCIDIVLSDTCAEIACTRISVSA